MIITLAGANFEHSGLGNIKYCKIYSEISQLGVIVNNIPQICNIGGSYEWTIELEVGYQFKSFSLIMNGEDKSMYFTEEGNILHISIPEVIGDKMEIKIETEYMTEEQYYTITYYDFYNNAINIETVKYGDSTPTPPDVPEFINEIYKFNGWIDWQDIVNCDKSYYPEYVEQVLEHQIFKLTRINNIDEITSDTSIMMISLDANDSTKLFVNNEFYNIVKSYILTKKLTISNSDNAELYAIPELLDCEPLTHTFNLLPVENQEGLYNLFVVKTKELVYQYGNENNLRKTTINYNDTLNEKYQWSLVSSGENSEFIRLTNVKYSTRFVAFNKGNTNTVTRFSSYKSSSGQADIMLYKVELITNPNDDSLNYISSIE